MQLNQAIAIRIKDLCNKKGITQYQLFKLSGVPQSTISTILNCTYPSMKLRIIYEICDGLGIELKDFFDSPLFSRDNLMD